MSRPYIPPGQGPADKRPPDLLEVRAADARSARRYRLAANVCFAAGVAISTVGAVSIFSSYGHAINNLDSLGADPRGMTPEYAWCLYVGIPLLVISLALRIVATVRAVGGR